MSAGQYSYCVEMKYPLMTCDVKFTVCGKWGQKQTERVKVHFSHSSAAGSCDAGQGKAQDATHMVGGAVTLDQAKWLFFTLQMQFTMSYQWKLVARWTLSALTR